MASGHIASISSSARTAQHNKVEAEAAAASVAIGSEPSSNLISSGHEAAAAAAVALVGGSDDLHQNDQLAKLSVLSLSDEDDCSSLYMPGRRVKQQQQQTDTRPNLVPSKLVQLDNIQDIDSNFNNANLHQVNALARLDEKWLEVSQNLDTTVKHLQDCSSRVTISSLNCLQALLNSVGTTCDSVDEDLKAFYDLMTKCDELTTKLSIAGSFRDEIKTLRKSVETLEQLYKSSQK